MWLKTAVASWLPLLLPGEIKCCLSPDRSWLFSPTRCLAVSGLVDEMRQNHSTTCSAKLERGNCALCRLFFPAVAYTGEWLIHALWPSACKTSNITILICTSLLFALVIKSEVHRWVWSAAVLVLPVQELAGVAQEDEGWCKQTPEGSRGSGVLPAALLHAPVLLCFPPACSLSPGMQHPRAPASLCCPASPCAIPHTRELRCPTSCLIS